MVYVGIDFSGSLAMWRPGCRRSNVWVAHLEVQRGMARVTDLRPVQDLPGSGSPFDRLVALLQLGRYAAAGIDAPFSIPASHVPGDHPTLVRWIGTLSARETPFPRAMTFLKAVASDLGPRGKKVFRGCERYWQQRGLRPRSTLWAGPRGGAAFTAACLSLLDRVGRPAWPWHSPRMGPCLVEAFPAAQLRVWGLPWEKYNGSDPPAQITRRHIVEGLREKVHLAEFRSEAIACADALDAVLSAFAAVAIARERLAVNPGPGWEKEGWIAVHL